VVPFSVLSFLFCLGSCFFGGGVGAKRGFGMGGGGDPGNNSGQMHDSLH